MAKLYSQCVSSGPSLEVVETLDTSKAPRTVLLSLADDDSLAAGAPLWARVSFVSGGASARRHRGVCCTTSSLGGGERVSIESQML